MKVTLCYLALLFTLLTGAIRANPWREVSYRSSYDGSEQPALFSVPASESPVPLLVGLHSWSGSYRQKNLLQLAEWCSSNGWAYIQPNFRGPNCRPEATGSEAALRDIVDAVDWASATAPVDTQAVYLVGASGGGHAALLAAGRYPGKWAGVSAWVPITDLAAWYRQCRAAGRSYADDLARSCGGDPGSSAEVDAEYRRRSPLTWLKRARGLPVQLSAGIRDGHTGSVPVSHSLHAFNLLSAPEDRLAGADISFMTRQAGVPDHLSQPWQDPVYGERNPVFRRRSGPVTLTLFDGGHEIVIPAALAWLELQYRTAQR